MASKIYNDISYIRSGVEFTGISTLAEIEKEVDGKHSVTVKWEYSVLSMEDIEKVCVLRAVLPPNVKANIGNKEVQNRFRLVYKWVRGENSESPATEFTDVFSWDNDQDLNLHNLNIDNSSDWNKNAFDDSINQIVQGRQGLIYKIYGFSRRMGRGATPLGFFCDGSSVVALSQKNQVINDNFYYEFGVVWSSKPSQMLDDENFVRIAVDMERDLDEQPMKSRGVWATTNKGRVVLFDYWTGKVKYSSTPDANNRWPIYGIGYSPTVKMFCYYDRGQIIGLREDPSTGLVSQVASFSGSEFNPTAEFSRRVVGGVCTTERSNGLTYAYFYLILNNEVVNKYSLTSSSITRKQIIPRTHFGCTNTVTGAENKKILVTPNNQNNIYGIGAGINGHVWCNGHTPVTISSTNVKPSGNPIKVFVRLGAKCKEFYKKYWNQTSPGRHVNKALTDVLGSSAEKIFELNSNLVFNERNWNIKQNWGENTPYSEDAMKDLVGIWNESAKLCGVGKRTYDQAKINKYTPGCALGANTPEALNYIKNQISKSPNKDKRQFAKGTPLTMDSVSWLPQGGPKNSIPSVIHAIHMELDRIEDYNLSTTEKSMLQDLNYVYGCTDGENYNDSNGRIEEFENPTAVPTASPNYRAQISGDTDDKSYRYFSSMTKWSYGSWVSEPSIYAGTFGWAGRPIEFYYKNSTQPSYKDENGYNTLDKKVGKPNVLDVRQVSADFNLSAIFDESVWVTTSARKAYTNPMLYNRSLPMSVGSVSPRLQYDGRMYIDKNSNDFYGAQDLTETNELSYEIMFADRREGKVGMLSYNRGAVDSGVADTSYASDINSETGGRRVTYTMNSSNQNVQTIDSEREFYPHYSDISELTNSTKRDLFFGRSPYHVVVDGDNNVWFTSKRYVGKIQMLDVGNGRDDRYVYDFDTGAGLHAFENNNRMKESSLYYYNVLAAGVAPTTSQSISDLYSQGQGILNGSVEFKCGDTEENKAYVYGCMTNSENWTESEVFGNAVACISGYKKSNGGEYSDVDSWNVDPDAEYNSDNFGLNCLVQMNSVELGPDYIHPVILSPTAKTKISHAESSSRTENCDADGQKEYWNGFTRIFDDDMMASGFDDLQTRHLIYDININQRELIRYEFVYNDPTYGSGSYLVSKEASAFPEDEQPDKFWHTPNYVGFTPTEGLDGIPTYGDLADLSSNAEYTAEMYLVVSPPVYSFDLEAGRNNERILVGRHKIHVFERWPTAKMCAAGIGTVDDVDRMTDYDLVGMNYWDDCNVAEELNNG